MTISRLRGYRTQWAFIVEKVSVDGDAQTVGGDSVGSLGAFGFGGGGTNQPLAERMRPGLPGAPAGSNASRRPERFTAHLVAVVVGGAAVGEAALAMLMESDAARGVVLSNAGAALIVLGGGRLVGSSTGVQGFALVGRGVGAIASGSAMLAR